MKAVALLLVFAASAFAQSVNRDFRTLFDCYGKDDGNYPSHGACSTAYVTCDAGHRTHRHCPVDTRYHAVLDKCLTEVKTPGCAAFSSDANLCFGRPSGFYPVEGDCSAFVFCAHEIMTRLTCAEGTHYNPLHLRCEDPATFHGSCGTRKASPVFDCHHRPAGKYAHADDCMAYFECDYDSGVWSFRCDHGYAFDGEGCSPIGGVDACLSARKADSEGVCAGGDGVFSDPTSCNHATMCWDGYGWDLGCGGDAPYWSNFIQGCGVVKADQCARDNADHLGIRDGDKAVYFFDARH